MNVRYRESAQKILSCATIITVFCSMLNPAFAAVLPTFAALETVANTNPINNQTATTAVIQSAISEVKASRTLNVSARPASGETITIGQCLVTFSDDPSTTSVDELNCDDNAATVDLQTSPGNANRPVVTLGGRLRSLTSLSDVNHGALAISGGGANAIFTTAGAETSASDISFSDNTTADVISTSNTPGVIALPKISTLTIADVEVGDEFTATFGGGNSVTFTATTASASDVAAGLNALIQGHLLYPIAAFTSAVSADVITFTGKVAGNGFVQNSSAINASPAAQVVTLTPANSAGFLYSATVDGNTVTHTTDALSTAATISAGIASTLSTANVTCVDDTTHITCTANTAGSAFTYSTLVTDVAGPVITLNGSTNMDVSHGSVFTDPGAVCVDNLDASCTVTPSGSVNTVMIGSYSVSYDAMDLSGNSAIQITRSVNVVDTDLPIITLLGTATVTVAQNSVYTDAGATATDNVDGDITASIVVGGSVDTSTLGDYTLTYDVSDIALNAATQVSRIVSVTDQTAPIVTEVTPISTPKNDNTPSYTFSTDEAGSITYAGGCTSTTTSAVVGNNTIELDLLADGEYVACSITVTDSAPMPNTSTPLTLSTFVIDTTDPTVTIDQAIGQDEVSANSTSYFTAVFDEPIVGATFTCDDIVTTNASCMNVTLVAGNTYTVQLQGLSAGTVTVSILGGGIEDLAGNTNMASTSTDNSVHFTASGGGGGGSVILPPPPASIPSETPTQPVAPVVVPPVNTPDATTPVPETSTEITPPKGTPLLDSLIRLAEENDDFITPPQNENGSELVSTSFPNNNTPQPTNNSVPVASTPGSQTQIDSNEDVTPPPQPIQEVTQNPNTDEKTETPEVKSAETTPDATVDIGGGVTPEEQSNTLPWILLGLIALLNFAWFYTRREKEIPPQS